MYFLTILLISILYSKNEQNEIVNGVYFIENLYRNLYFNINNNELELNNINKANFRIINIKKGAYYIESLKKYKIGVNYLDKIIFKIDVDKDDLKFQWNIINIKKNYVIIQNNYNLKIIEERNGIIKFINYQIFKQENLLINKSKIFLLIKLYEEFKSQKTFLKKTAREPIDVLIKYIDLNDKSLNRTGIAQSYKDVDNEELRYSLKSIFKNIPWVRKIYILMPNKLVKYLKPVDEIKDKIIYIKDKDLLGFDSANIQSFLFNLHKTENFGISKNFIYMEDDCFIGRKMSKNDLFYYEKNEKKVVPYIISSIFFDLNKTLLFNNYFYIFKRYKIINPHSREGFRQQMYNTEKFILENYNRPLTKVMFTHNAVPENIDDLKDIYYLSYKYEYNNISLLSKYRHILSLCHEHFWNIFNLNIKKRKVNIIYTKYVALEKIKKKVLKKKLFVINTGGNHIPLNRDYKIQKKVIYKKFTFNIIYDIKKEKKIYVKHFINQNNKILKLYILFILLKMVLS